MKIQELLKAVVAGPGWPERLFLLEGLTFGQVYDRAETIKSAMRQAGCSSTPVCLCTEDRGFMAAAMLASLTGGPPLLLPYAFNERTLLEAYRSMPYHHALLQDSSALPEGVMGISMPDAITGSVYHGPADIVDPDAVWLYLFTGGSTGSPRIWSKSPRNLLMEAANLARAFDIQNSDVILASVPPNHIYGLLYSVLLPLVSGACVSVRTPSYPNDIIQAMNETRASVFVSIPAHYRVLNVMRIPGHSIHTAYSSAGALAEQDDRDFFQSSGVAITEVYGSTETGGIAYRRRCADQPSLRPFSYVDVKIDGELLLVRSDFLSAELEKDAEGFFLTADRVSTKAPTEFEILGRSDGIVKVGGKRVDLAGIRQVILDIEGVDDAYVYANPVKSGRENEIIAVAAGRVGADRICEAAKNELPSYAAPRRVKVVDHIPMSATGKYNRKAIEEIVKS